MSHKPESSLDIFWIYLKLGCLCFGGPVAHLGFFKEAFVNQRKWLSEQTFAELLGFCQFVPGPSSSQLGFAIAWHRGGLVSACAAWLGFTLPSATIMTFCAYSLFRYREIADPAIDGFLIAAVAIVAKAVLDLGKKVCPDGRRLIITIIAASMILTVPGSIIPIAVIALAGAFGAFVFQGKTIPTEISLPAPKQSLLSIVCLLLFVVLLFIAFLTPDGTSAALYADHYEAGALVFGGGHVVLPLLYQSVVSSGFIGEQDFLSGYSLAQALPGPLFTLSAFLGTVASNYSPAFVGGLLALIAIFLPGLLLVVGLLPFWQKIRQKTWAQAALLGANAAVVGLLMAAFINPVWQHGIHRWTDFIIAVSAFFALDRLKAPAWLVVSACGLIGLVW